MNHILTSVLFFFVISTTLQAERFFQVLNFTSSDKVPEEVELYTDAETKQVIELTKRRFSPTYQIEKNGELTLVIAEKGYPDPSNLKGFPTVVIKKSWKKFIIIAVPDPKNKKLPIRLIPMELGSDFKKGDFRFVNFSNIKYGITAGSKKALLKTKGIKTLGNLGEQNKGVRMEVSWWRDETESWRPLSNQLIRYNKHTRIMFFMYMSDGATRPTFLAADIAGI